MGIISRDCDRLRRGQGSEQRKVQHINMFERSHGIYSRKVSPFCCTKIVRYQLKGPIHLFLGRTVPIWNMGKCVYCYQRIFALQSCRVAAIVNVHQKGWIHHSCFLVSRALQDRKTQIVVHISP